MITSPIPARSVRKLDTLLVDDALMNLVDVVTLPNGSTRLTLAASDLEAKTIVRDFEPAEFVDVEEEEDIS